MFLLHHVKLGGVCGCLVKGTFHQRNDIPHQHVCKTVKIEVIVKRRLFIMNACSVCVRKNDV